MAIAYLGDDLTDEDAFHVLRGHGLTVLVKTDYRETIADAWIRPPQELMDLYSVVHRAHWLETRILWSDQGRLVCDP